MQVRRGISAVWLITLVSLGGLLSLAGSTAASEWCGENGLIRLMFMVEDERTAVHSAIPGEDGTTRVELYAYLDDVTPLHRDQEALVSIGGFELTLQIAGADGFIVAEAFPFKVINVGSRLGACITGIDPGQKLLPDGTELVHWTVVFAGHPRNVVFRLDPAAILTCRKLAGCAESGTYAVYVGSVASGQAIDVFGAGYAPAYLNWDSQPDLTPLTGVESWQDVGRYSARE